MEQISIPLRSMNICSISKRRFPGYFGFWVENASRDIDNINVELEDKHIIARYSRERVSITDEFSSFDEELDRLADNFVLNRKPVRRKLKICSFEKEYLNESRLYKTELGDIVADAFKEIYDAGLVIL